PWVDLEGKAPSIENRAAQDPMVTKATLHWMAAMYLNGADPRTPLAAPLYADLKGLPPVMVQVGTAEILLDDGVRIAEKLHAAGVETLLRVWPNMFHIWPVFAPHLSEGRDACLEAGNFIRAKTA